MSLPSLPVSGQPFSFGKVLDCVLIPRCVFSDKSLLPGARVMWGVIRQKAFSNGVCTLSYAALAGELSCKAWAARKYCRQLERAGLLRTSQRPGMTPAHQLLWADRFADSVEVEQGGAIAQGGALRSHKGGVAIATGHIRNSGFKSGLTGRESLKVESMGNRAGEPAAAQPAAPGRKEKYFSDAERNAIREHINAIGLETTGGCIAHLSRKAEHYGRTGFQVAAAIERAWRKVQRKPSSHPEKIQWIFAVVENEFSQTAFPMLPAIRVERMARAGDLLKPWVAE